MADWQGDAAGFEARWWRGGGRGKESSSLRWDCGNGRFGAIEGIVRESGGRGRQPLASDNARRLPRAAISRPRPYVRERGVVDRVARGAIDGTPSVRAVDEARSTWLELGR